VRGSWARELPYVKLAAGERALSCAGWLSREAGERLLGLAGKTVDELLAESEKASFRPIDLGIQIHRQGGFPLARVEQRNVVGAGRRQRSEAEGRSRDLQRALGPPGDRPRR